MKIDITPGKNRYRPTIRRLQEDFARRVALAAMKKRREAKYGPSVKLALEDNSEPWLENPNSVADYWYISEQIRKSKERWQTQFNHSSPT